MTAPGDGVIRSWAVRGASGELTLQVARVRGERVVLTGFSQTAQRDRIAGPHAFRASIPVRRGDAIGVLLAPGATIGTRAGGAAPRRCAGRAGFRTGPRSAPANGSASSSCCAPTSSSAPVPRRRRSPARGRARCPAGAVLAAHDVAEPAGASVRVEVVRVGGAVAVDASLGGRRLARTELEGARPAGELIALEVDCGFRHGFCVRWLNEGASVPVVHAYRLAPGGRAFRMIG